MGRLVKLVEPRWQGGEAAWWRVTDCPRGWFARSTDEGGNWDLVQPGSTTVPARVRARLDCARTKRARQ